ncbi:hypothetical protein [Cupriavidus pauculus]|uniref:hypothetical protein n=1 Tax=Cupriavidus pauculus TaxID=82633 RepID=UPI0012FDD6A5|nr:hypothetical protein [Cupriavidus pauculus]
MQTRFKREMQKKTGQIDVKPAGNRLDYRSLPVINLWVSSTADGIVTKSGNWKQYAHANFRQFTAPRSG